MAWRRLGLVALFTVTLVVGTAAPASAHGVSGTQPSNYETRVLSISPRVSGLSIRPVDLGSRLELRNETNRTAVVSGYEGEPYLRVGPGGVFENRRSPAVYLNRTRYGSGQPPESFDAAAPPVWRRIGSGQSVRWHDHRAHWMSRSQPPSVRRAPGSTHLLQRFTLEVLLGDTVVTVRGDVRWVPGPSPWPWLAAAGLLAVIVAFASRTRWWGWVLATVTVGIVTIEAVHVSGLFGATTASPLATLGASAFSLGGLVLGGLALVWILRSGASAAVPLVLFAAVVLVVAGGLSDITVLWRSQIPTTLPAWIARAAVSLILGLGIGAIVGAALHVRPPTAPPGDGLDAADAPRVTPVRDVEPLG